LPVVSFSSGIVCLGNPTLFLNAVTISTGSVTNYSWDFGDSYTSNQQQPGHTYTSAGTFNVSLIVTSNNGCTASAIQPVTVNPLPVANAGVDQTIAQE